MTTYKSQNGWPASKSLKIKPLVVAGENFAPGISANADVYTVLQYVAEQLHKRVEPIVKSGWHQADDWGYYFRANVNNPSSLSNHSSGTAFDYNATRHPNGVAASKTFTAKQISEIHKILAEVGNVVRWGGDYKGTPDAMHFEINANAAAVKTVANKLRGGKPATPSTPATPTPAATTTVLKKGSKGAQVKAMQAGFNEDFPSYSKLVVDGRFGDATENVVKEFQKRSGLKPDGVVGPDTVKELAKYGIKITLRKASTTKPPVKSPATTPAPTPTPAPAPATPDASTAAEGIDVSEYQYKPHAPQDIDWAKVKAAGKKFAIHKLGGSNRGGKLYLDPAYKKNAAAAKAAGLINGHYFFNGKQSGATEAQFFLDNLTAYTAGEAIVYDFETDDNNGVVPSVPQAREFFQRILKSNDKANLWLYLNESQYNSTDVSSIEKLGVRIWLAKYSKTAPKLVSKTNANRYHMWQYTSSGKVNGIAKDTDLNKIDNVDFLSKPQPKPPVAPAGTTHKITIAHASMQFSDTKTQKQADAEKLFAEANTRKWEWITGTELGAGNDEGRAIVRAEAKKAGYTFNMNAGQDSWIAIKQDVVTTGSLVEYYKKVVDGVAKQYTSKGVYENTFKHTTLGPVTISACHYLTKGRPDAKDPAYKVHVKQNEKLAVAIAFRANAHLQLGRLFFYGGDQNIVDKDGDTFFGQPIFTAWDERKKWDNTGHGNIDVIGRHKNELRVKATMVRALDDTELFQHSDHFVIEASYEITLS